MADGDLKMLIDCARAVDDPEHAQIVPITARERQARDAEVTRMETAINLRARARRDTLLAASDWTQARDSPLSETEIADWATYRQALRDMNLVGPSPAFPTPPGG